MLSSLIEFPPSSIFCSSSQIDDLQYRVREREKYYPPSFSQTHPTFRSPDEKEKAEINCSGSFFHSGGHFVCPPPRLQPRLPPNIKTRGRGGKRKGGVGRRRNSPICSVGFVAQTLTSTFPFLHVGILLTFATFFGRIPPHFPRESH